MHNPYAAPQAGLDAPASLSREPRLFSWKGRIGRIGFLAYCLAGMALALGLAVAVGLLDMALADYSNSARNAWLWPLEGAVLLLVPLLTILPAIHRRLHDFDVRGWHVWMVLVPFVQLIFVIYLLVSPGGPKANRFGPVPPPNSRVLVAGTAFACVALLAAIALRFP